MTDSDIIKALECCSSNATGNEYCKDCPYNIYEYCGEELAKDTLDLINRQRGELRKKQVRIHKLLKEANQIQDYYDIQKAEIERLKSFEKKVLEPIIEKFQRRDCPFSPFDEYCTGHCVNCENWLEYVDINKNLKFEAYRELSEKLKEYCSDITSDNINEPNVRILWDAETTIDDVVKELLEGK